MKTGFFTSLMLFVIPAFAQVDLVEEKGRIEFLLSHTMTCLGMSCPPSKPYYQAVFVPENKSLPAIMYIGAHSQFGLTSAPKVINFGKVELYDQQQVVISGRANLDTGLFSSIYRIAPRDSFTLENDPALLSVRVIPMDDRRAMARMVVGSSGAVLVQSQDGVKNKIAQISEEDLAAIRAAIQKTKGQRMERKQVDFQCQAESDRTVITEGADGRVQLALGQFPCGEVFVNQAPEAQILVEYGQDLANRYLQ